MPKVERDGTTYQGILYQSASGGITPEIFTHAIKNVWGPCYPTSSAEQVVASLCDAYGYHWDKEVLVGGGQSLAPTLEARGLDEV